MTRILTPCLVLILLCVAAAGSRAQTSTAVFINEIHYDNTGTDTGEFIEVAGPAGTDLSAYSIVLYNGANGQFYDIDALSGVIPDQQDGFGTVRLSYLSNGIQNGAPDGIALVQGVTVIQFLSYEGTFTATNGPASGQTSINIGVAENGTEPVDMSLQLQGTGTVYGEFTWSASAIAATPGTVNTGQSFVDTLGATLSVSDVSVMEGDSGTVDATFIVTVSGAHSGVTFDIATADGTATAGHGDYLARSESAQLIPPDVATYVFSVAVNGDLTFESDERFSVALANISGATVSDGQGIATVTNDDAAPPVTSDVVISQVYGGGGNAGATFTHDFIELFNRSTESKSLKDWSVQYTSASGSEVWTVTPLSGSIAAGGYYLVRQARGTGGTTPLPSEDATGSIPLAATAGKVALRRSTAPITGACPTTADTADLIGYGGANCFEGTQPAPATSNTTAVLRKRGGCFDSNANVVDFAIGSPNPRNSKTDPRSCEYVSAAIHQIQGDNAATPYLGRDVSTTGVVTAKKSNGFFLQTPDNGDDDPTTSQGLFVFTASTPAVAVGDIVAARGTAGEFFSLTQLESSLPGDVTVESSGHDVPAPVTLTTAMLDPDGPPDQLERFESMRMHAEWLIAVAPTNDFGEIFTVLPGVARPMREPGIGVSSPVPPDPTTGVPDCCIPRFDENPQRIAIDTDGLAGAPRTLVTSHASIANVTGPLDFSFGVYKVLPETPPDITGGMSAVAVPLPADDEFTVAGFNIENFANDETQRRKAALAIRQVLHSPDVIGHIEILDLASLEALAAQVNRDAEAAGEPSPAYEARLIPAAGGTQNVGFLIKTSRVRIDAVTQERASETYIDPGDGQPKTLHDRPPLVLRATVTLPHLSPQPIIVIVNHLRSFLQIELMTGDGPRVRAKRTAQAESLAGLLQALQTENPTTPVISIGDYNAFEFNDGYTDPIAIIKGMPTADEQIVVDGSPDLVDPNFINLTDTALPAAERYSFIFEGTPQALDHVLVNTVADARVRRYAIARNNADFPEGLFTADASRPEGNSDHDMPVAYFVVPDTIAPTVTATANVTTIWPANHKLVGVEMTISATDNKGVVSCAIASVSSNEATNGRGDGNTEVDWFIDGATSLRLRAERSGDGSGRIYTIAVECADSAGNIGSATTTLTVADRQSFY
jgi:predicted extracellular nuclease